MFIIVVGFIMCVLYYNFFWEMVVCEEFVISDDVFVGVLIMFFENLLNVVVYYVLNLFLMNINMFFF